MHLLSSLASILFLPNRARLLQRLHDIPTHDLPELLVVPAHIVALKITPQTPGDHVPVLQREEVFLLIVPHHRRPETRVVRVVLAGLIMPDHPVFEGGLRVYLHQEDAEFEERYLRCCVVRKRFGRHARAAVGWRR